MATIISEKAIEEAVEQLNSVEGTFDEVVNFFQEEQPDLLAYLFSETFDVFTQSEKEFFFFLTLVVCRAIKAEAGDLPQITEKELSQAEERNWALLAERSSSRFHERLDVFFEDSNQEELLAFAEDALSDDTDELVTKEGREAMFVSLKSIIDCLLDDQAA